MAHPAYNLHEASVEEVNVALVQCELTELGSALHHLEESVVLVTLGVCSFQGHRVEISTRRNQEEGGRTRRESENHGHEVVERAWVFTWGRVASYNDQSLERNYRCQQAEARLYPQIMGGYDDAERTASAARRSVVSLRGARIQEARIFLPPARMTCRLRGTLRAVLAATEPSGPPTKHRGTDQDTELHCGSTATAGPSTPQGHLADELRRHCKSEARAFEARSSQRAKVQYAHEWYKKTGGTWQPEELFRRATRQETPQQLDKNFTKMMQALLRK
ncbi:hypothetical protein C8Q80DRAFT_1123618 [Daedaleopsis nitida]|nr:hypothetical protein C8Q80DRAFT_1123618 [Daedaleopsis nitida]